MGQRNGIMQENQMLNNAIEYLKHGLCVIPAEGKKPIVAWTEYQKRLPSEKDLTQWFTKDYPNANLGFITGLISGIAVIDIDSPEGKEQVSALVPDSLIFPIAESPSGGEHWYFRCLNADLQTQKGVEGFKKVDIRANGGFIVAPPSVNYKWRISILDVETPLMPKSLYEKMPKKIDNQVKKPEIRTGMFSAGSRDDDLFHTAWNLAKGKMPNDEIYQVLLALCKNCDPPMPIKVAQEKVVSAIKRANAQPRDIDSEIKAWLIQQERFKIESIFNELELKDKESKARCRKVITELVEKGILEPDKGLGVYRLIDKQIEHIEIPEDAPEALDVKFPLGVENLCSMYSGNVAVIAGAGNTGKSIFCLNFANKNRGKFHIRYQSSEMDGQELRLRLGGFGIGMDIFRKEIEWVKKSSDWWDLILPDAINIIDFMEIYENFYEVGKWISKIFNRLNKGIALIALQKKNSMTDDGRGGAFTREKARVYLSMNYNELKITKAKNWASHVNPNGMKINFEIEKGISFKNINSWRQDDE